MFESRCGVSCEHCERKAAVHCLGCCMMEKPFWGGICEVKACCEEKSLDHCGQCEDFPCALCANQGVEMGYDPEPRLALLTKWRKEEIK